MPMGRGSFEGVSAEAALLMCVANVGVPDEMNIGATLQI